MKLLELVFMPVLLASCGTANLDKSQMKVTNGRQVRENYQASVVKINGCTATFVKHNVLLTAAHCTWGKDYVDVMFSNKKIKSRRIIQNRAYNIRTSSGVYKKDLALIIVDDFSAPAISRICYQAPTVGEPIALLGYGLNNLETRTGAGIKREGFNYLREIRDGLLLFEGQHKPSDNSGNNAASGSGDSGGPLFSTAKNCLIGVTSGGYINGSRKFSKYVDIKGSLLEKSFDWVHYVTSNEDLIRNIGADPEELYRHWERSGLMEGRSPNAAYYPRWYIDHNPDLPQEVKSSYRNLFMHWQMQGKSECRDGSPYFNARAYMNLYPNISRETQGRCDKATGHWLYIGLSNMLKGR